MKKLILFIALVLACITLQAQDHYWKIPTGDYTFGSTYVAKDTIRASDTWTYMVRSSKSVGLLYSVTVNVHKLSGAPNLYVAIFGKATLGGAWVAIDSALYTDSGADSIRTLTGSSYLAYNYWCIKLTSDATAQKTKIKSVDWQFFAANVTGSLTVSGNVTSATLNTTGVATMGDAYTDQHIFNGNLTSGYFQSMADINLLTRQHIISGTCKLTAASPFATKSQMEGGFFAVQIDAGTTISIPFTIVGSESKGTLDRDASDATSLVIGAYNKVSLRKAITFAGTAIGTYSFLGRDNTATIAQGYNYFAEVSAAGFTSKAIMGTHADTWTYGLDFNSATFATADIRLSNGEIIDNITDGAINLAAANLRTSTINFCDSTKTGGVANAYTLDFVPNLTVAIGTKIGWIAEAACTGATTIDVDGAGAVAIVEYSGGSQSALDNGDIIKGQYVEMVWDGTAYQMISGH